MQLVLFEVLSKAKNREYLRSIEPRAQEVREKYMCDLEDADVSELAIHRRLSSLTYSRRCAEASAVQAYQKRGMQFASGMEIGYVVRDAAKGELSTEKRCLGV